jgi:hypothetical protein
VIVKSVPIPIQFTRDPKRQIDAAFDEIDAAVLPPMPHSSSCVAYMFLLVFNMLCLTRKISDILYGSVKIGSLDQNRIGGNKPASNE